MRTKRTVLAVAVCMAMAVNSFALDDIKRAYLDGIGDTIKLFSQKKNYADKEVVLNGYAVQADVSKIPVSEIVKYEILAQKLGYSPLLVNENTLVFGVFNRKADAVAAVESLDQYSLRVKPTVKKYDRATALSTPVMKNFIPRLAVLVVEKSGSYYDAPARGECNVVNKILTTNAFINKYHGSLRELARASYRAAKASGSKRAAKVKKNLAKAPKRMDVYSMNFGKLAKTVYNYGVVKNGKLLLFGRMYGKGDRITKNYAIADILPNGTVVLQRIGKSTIKNVQAKRG